MTSPYPKDNKIISYACAVVQDNPSNWIQTYSNRRWVFAFQDTDATSSSSDNKEEL